MHYCFSCREWRKLNAQRMCAPCMTMWLSATPADRRRLLHVVGADTTLTDRRRLLRVAADTTPRP